jgi:hypothetical protein
MSISLAPALGSEDRDFRPSHSADELETALQLANLLCDRLSMPIVGEQALGVRTRLVRAHALSIVDLLTDITRDRIRGR